MGWGWVSQCMLSSWRNQTDPCACGPRPCPAALSPREVGSDSSIAPLNHSGLQTQQSDLPPPQLLQVPGGIVEMGSENFLREGRELLATLGLGELLNPMGLGRAAL